eukprot:1872652-Amphidinium_carterae.1
MQIRALNTPFFRISVRLMSFHPYDLNPSRKRSQGSALQVPVSAFRWPASSSESRKAGNQTFLTGDSWPTVCIGFPRRLAGDKVTSTSRGMKLTTKSSETLLCKCVKRLLMPGLISKISSRKDTVKTALNAALGGVWHDVEDLEHSVHHYPAWAAARREAARPAPPASAPMLLRVSSYMGFCLTSKALSPMSRIPPRKPLRVNP